MENIIIPENCEYLSDAIQELPINCIFDKGKVGCGGTTLALESKKNYVICVPFVALIENKEYQHDDVLGVYGGVPESKINEYLATAEVKRILVTYDSLPRVMDMIDPKEYNLLVDEYHLLFCQYSFRKYAATCVLTNYKAFKTYCFMTATPLEPDFILEELKGLPMVEAIWKDTKMVTVNSVQCVNTPVDATIFNLVKRFLDGSVEGNCYLFVNSVEFIRDIVINCGLTEENCRVIYSKQNKTKVGITNGTSTDAPKKINLLTSTVFEGTDFYDKEGKIFIVSDNRKMHTLTDISTSFQQIAGRIRDTQYWDTITHIFTTTRYYNNLSYNEFRAAAFKQIDTARAVVEELNKLSPEARKGIQKLSIESYVSKVDDIFTFDGNLLKIDLYNFKICKSIYKLRVNVSKELIRNGFTVKPYDSKMTIDVIRMDSDAKNFKETVQEIETLNPFNELYIAALEKYPFLSKAIELLGFKGIKERDYIITNIKKEMIKKLDSSIEVKVAKTLKLTNKFTNGEFISAKEAKETIAKYYKEFNVNKTPNIKNFYEVKETTKRVNGNVVKGYIVIIPKLILNQE